MFLEKEKEDIESEQKFVPSNLDVSGRVVIDLTIDDD